MIKTIVTFILESEKDTFPDTSRDRVTAGEKKKKKTPPPHPPHQKKKKKKNKRRNKITKDE